MMASLLFVACTSDDDDAVKIESLTILPSTITAYCDQALSELNLSVTPNDALSGKTVEWTSSHPEIISVVDGVLTFQVKDIAENELPVTITATVDGKSATSVITVKGQISKYEILDFTEEFGLLLLDKNVGADNVGDAGNYYQWGKNAAVLTAGQTELNSNYDAQWTAEGEGYSDWSVADNTPCPMGWSIPDNTQVKAMADALEDIAYWWMDFIDDCDEAKALLASMKLAASGVYRVDKEGNYLPNADYFWSSYSETTDNGKVAYAFENNNFPTMGKSNLVSSAMPVRCVKAVAAE